jgi:PAS domain S-box-containing protein
MSEVEALRTALIELDRLRARERAASHESATLLRLLDGMTQAADSDTAVGLLIDIARQALGADAAALIGAGPEGGVIVRLASDPVLTGLVWPEGGNLLDRPRRMTDLNRGNWGGPVPGALADYAALVVRRIEVTGEPPVALICLSRKVAAFSPTDQRLLDQIARIAGQAIDKLRLARRNALLAGLIDGSVEGSTVAGMFDAPLEAVTRAVDRLTRAQAAVVEITNDLLRAPSDEVDRAIDRALARTGELAGSDRTYVFRLRDADLMDNTHEWTAPGVVPMLAELQGMPNDLMSLWLPAFDADCEVSIPDVLELPEDHPVRAVLEMQDIRSLLVVPMRQDGRLRGFVGYDAVNETRSFLPGEILLLRSVANVINAVMERRAAEQAAQQAGAALRAERNRMQATLVAMPDLLLELDAVGRIEGYHCEAIPAVNEAARALVGRMPEAAMKSDAATVVRAVIADVDMAGHSAGRTLEFEIGGEGRTFQISAAVRRGDAGERGYVFVMRDITEERAQLREIELLSEVARRSTNLIVVSDRLGRIDWVNAAFEKSTGWRLAEVRGQRPGDFLQSERTDPATRARIGAALRAGEAVSVDIENRTREGRDFWVHLDIQPLTDGSGRLIGFMAVQSDITERRQQEAELAATMAAAVAARARLVAAVEALQDGFAIYDAAGQMVLCNEPYRNLYPRSAHLVVPGARYEELLRRRLADGEFLDAIGREDDWLDGQLAGHGRPIFETEQPLVGGRWVRVIEKATPEGGRVVLRVDITALKVAEQRALEERAAAMEASRDGIAIADASGQFLYMNPAYRAMFGIGPEEDIRAVEWFDLLRPESVATLRGIELAELKRLGSWRGEIVGLHREGHEVEQEVSLTLQAHGGFVCIARDIADRRRGEAERARLREELQIAQRREVVGQIAAGLAHDFNNFLAVIAGSVEVIEDRQGPGGRDAADVSRIRQAAERAADLVARLRDLGRSGGTRAGMDMVKSLEEAADLLRSGLPWSQRLTLSVPEDPVIAWSDPVDVLQVVLNLAINARDALGAEGGEITLRVAPAPTVDPQRLPDVGRFQQGRAYVELVVADTGAGMDETIQARVFEPYFSTKGERGTGLGLAIIAGIIRANGAALWLDSRPGEGTRITILWPQTPEQVVDGLAVSTTGRQRLDGLRLLVVDDSEAVCEVFAAILEKAGAEVVTTSDPADARESILSDPVYWSALVTDHDMPGLSGSDLARAVRQVRPDMPIVLVSALPERAEEDGALFDAVLGKPVAEGTLVATLTHVVAARGKG